MRRWDVLIQLLKDRPHAVGAEIGVRHGATTAPLLAALPGIRRYYAVDPWLYYAGYENDRNGAWPSQPLLDRAFEQFRKRTAIHAGRIVVLRAFSADAAPKVPDASLDFVFIDANHAREYVAQDIALWTPTVKPGGIISGHDYGKKTAANWGVKEAVDEAFAAATVHLADDSVWWTEKGNDARAK
jgi:hypothetical protein